jgi:hypothetical protein
MLRDDLQRVNRERTNLEDANIKIMQGNNHQAKLTHFEANRKQ